MRDNFLQTEPPKAGFSKYSGINLDQTLFEGGRTLDMNFGTLMMRAI